MKRTGSVLMIALLILFQTIASDFAVAQLPLSRLQPAVQLPRVYIDSDGSARVFV
jgi:hypothetical protein